MNTKYDDVEYEVVKEDAKKYFSKEGTSIILRAGPLFRTIPLS